MCREVVDWKLANWKDWSSLCPLLRNLVPSKLQLRNVFFFSRWPTSLQSALSAVWLLSLCTHIAIACAQRTVIYKHFNFNNPLGDPHVRYPPFEHANCARARRAAPPTTSPHKKTKCSIFRCRIYLASVSNTRCWQKLTQRLCVENQLLGKSRESRFFPTVRLSGTRG